MKRERLDKMPAVIERGDSCIVQGNNIACLAHVPDAVARLIYIDPPFNTGRTQKRNRVKVRADDTGTRVGFGGRTYTTEKVDSPQYADRYGDFCGFLMPRIEAALRCLTEDGSIFVHLDFREAHYVKVAMDALMGRANFLGEIIWAYDFGGRSKKRWPAKHDTILWYARDAGNYVFDYGAMERIPYMAPGLVSNEKAARGKTPTDVWWHTIVPTNGKEKTGYPTQKPLGVLERIIKVHSEEGDLVLDFFAGSGTTAAAAAKHGRRSIMIDENPEACDVMARRLGPLAPTVVFEHTGIKSLKIRSVLLTLLWVLWTGSAFCQASEPVSESTNGTSAVASKATGGSKSALMRTGAPSRSAWQVRLEVDLPLTLAAAVGASSWLLGDQLGPAYCAPLCDKGNVWSLDRPAAGLWSPAWRATSDIGVGVVLAGSVAVLALDQLDDSFWPDALVMVQTVLFTNALSSLVGLAARRPRPLLYGEQAPVEQRVRGSTSLSFFSGHTANSFAAVTALFWTLRQRNPGSSWPWVVWGVGVLGASFVGLGRVLSGAHFPTDVFAGAAVGLSAGFAIPELHRRSLPIRPIAFEQGAGVGVGLVF